MLARHGDRQRRHQLEARDPIAQCRTQIAEQTHARCDVRHSGKRRDARAGGRVELQHGGRHDTQRALGADEELLEIVAGVVLAQPAQTVPDAAVGQHDFDAEHELARVAEAQHRGASGIGREIAADRAAPFGRKRKRKEQPVVGGGLLDGGERHAGFGRQRRIVGIDGAHAVHPRERQHDRVALGVGRCAAALSRVSALRDDRDAQIRAGANDRGHFVGATGAHDRQRASVEAAAPVGDIGKDVGFRRQDLRAADGRVEPRPQGCANVGHERR